MRFYVETALGQVHGVRQGAGRPLLLVGSAGRSSRQFRALVPLLAKTFDVVAPDLPGFGASDPLPRGTTIEALADLLAEVLDRLGIGEAAFYGLHTGNKVGTALAVRHPRRVARLILAGQSHSLVPDRERRNAGIGALIAASVDVGRDGPVPPAARAAAATRLLEFLGGTAGAADGTHPALGGDLIDHALDAVQATGTPTLYRANLAYDLEAGFRAIRVPTLVLEVETPAEMSAIGPQASAVAALIPGATAVALPCPDAGEPLTLEDRVAELAPIIRGFAGA